MKTLKISFFLSFVLGLSFNTFSNYKPKIEKLDKLPNYYTNSEFNKVLFSRWNFNKLDGAVLVKANNLENAIKQAINLIKQAHGANEKQKTQSTKTIINKLLVVKYFEDTNGNYIINCIFKTYEQKNYNSVFSSLN